MPIASFMVPSGGPALRRDAEIIFKVLHEHRPECRALSLQTSRFHILRFGTARPDATVHGILRSVKDIDDDEVLAGLPAVTLGTGTVSRESICVQCCHRRKAAPRTSEVGLAARGPAATKSEVSRGHKFDFQALYLRQRFVGEGMFYMSIRCILKGLAGVPQVLF